MKAEDFINNNYHSRAGLELDKLIEDATGKEVSFEEIAEAYHNYKINKPNNKIGVNSKVYLKGHSHITGVIIDSSDVGFNHWMVRWDESSELIREYGSDLILISKNPSSNE